jgi:hypothetical protein
VKKRNLIFNNHRPGAQRTLQPSFIHNRLFRHLRPSVPFRNIRVQFVTTAEQLILRFAQDDGEKALRMT